LCEAIAKNEKKALSDGGTSRSIHGMQPAPPFKAIHYWSRAGRGTAAMPVVAQHAARSSLQGYPLLDQGGEGSTDVECRVQM